MLGESVWLELDLPLAYGRPSWLLQVLHCQLARGDRPSLLHGHPQQEQGEGEKQGVADPADADGDVDGEAYAAGDGETGCEHAGGAVDAPQPWRQSRIQPSDESHAGRETKPHEQAGG